MAAFVTRLFPTASTESIAEFETLISIALFSGIGLLLSVGVIVLDKYTPGEWF